MADREIIGIDKGGYDHQGLTIVFEAKFKDGSTEGFRCPSEALAKLVVDLRYLGELAETARRSQPGSMFELIRGYTATDTRTGVDQAGNIVLRISTPEGIPIDVAMPHALARQTIERLATSLLQAKEPVRKN